MKFIESCLSNIFNVNNAWTILDNLNSDDCKIKFVNLVTNLPSISNSMKKVSKRFLKEIDTIGEINF